MSLRVGEPQPSEPKLLPEHAVLFLEIVDDVALLLVHPTGERDEDEPQREHGVKGTRGRMGRLLGPCRI
jgi:hypothetical protein